jgi:hypothetical protein
MYDFNDAIHPHDRVHAPWKQSPLTARDLNWLEEIASHKATHFPHLARIILLEPCGSVFNGKYSPKELSLPLKIQNSLEEAGIVFRGVVRQLKADATR